MNLWTALKISPTRDIKEIKRAYARELKVTRPDENPEAFQVLYDAYQMALDYAENLDEDDSDKFMRETLEQTQNTNPGIIEENTELLSEDSPIELVEEKEHQLRMAEHERIITEVKRLLEIYDVGYSLQSWSFITASPYIFEDKFNWYLGKEIFKIFSVYQNYYSRKISRELLSFCDDIFLWSSKAYSLQEELSENLSKKILSELDEPYMKKYNMTLRGGALITAFEELPKQKKVTEKTLGCGMLLQILFILVAIACIAKKFYEK